MNLTFLEEPELEFGAGRHIDIRFGIMNYGPLDFETSLAQAHQFGHRRKQGIRGGSATLAGAMPNGDPSQTEQR